MKSRKRKRGESCSLGQTAASKSCSWKLKTFKHGDARPWGGKFITGKEHQESQRWFVLLGPGGEHRQFFQKCLALRVRKGLCQRKVSR